MAGKIIRVTMFKLPSKENQQKMMGLYKVLSETARKVYRSSLCPPHPRLSSFVPGLLLSVSRQLTVRCM